MQPGAGPQNLNAVLPGLAPAFYPAQPFVLPGMPVAVQQPLLVQPSGVAQGSPQSAEYWQYWNQYVWQLQQQQQQQQAHQPQQPPQPQQQLHANQGNAQSDRQQQQQQWGIQPNEQGLYVLFVYHLPHNVSEDMLRSLFVKCGSVAEVVIMRDDMTDPASRTKGFGFVKYKTYEEAACAVQYLNGHQLENKRLEVSFKLPKGQKRN